MDGLPHRSMGDCSYVGILPGSQKVGVFLGEGESDVFRLWGPAQIGYPEMGSGPSGLDNKTKSLYLGLVHDRPAPWAAVKHTTGCA